MLFAISYYCPYCNCKKLLISFQKMDELLNVVDSDVESGEFENARSRNISKNFEFMRACGMFSFFYIHRFL